MKRKKVKIKIDSDMINTFLIPLLSVRKYVSVSLQAVSPLHKIEKTEKTAYDRSIKI